MTFVTSQTKQQTETEAIVKPELTPSVMGSTRMKPFTCLLVRFPGRGKGSWLSKAILHLEG